MNEDTIVALATAYGEAGIAIIRLSGSRATELGAALFRPKYCRFHEIPPWTMRYGTALDRHGKPLDKALAVWFRPPRSYTGEPVVELHCHGGSLVAREIVEESVAIGARIAEPGEFTRRAFLNGRIDLPQAEAVLGLIRARSHSALQGGYRSLAGGLSGRLSPLYQQLLRISAQLEVRLDHPEEELPALDGTDLTATLAALQDELENLIAQCNAGRYLREGLRIAIVGRPNVGKSTLLNALVREARAIVTAIPGTTRDVIEEVLSHQGIPLRLTDTAGLRETEDPVEAAGIARAWDAFRDADVRVWVIEGNSPLSEEDHTLAARIADRPFVVALNKSDLPQVTGIGEIRTLAEEAPVCPISAEQKQGLEELKAHILAVGGVTPALSPDFSASSRQLGELKEAHASLTDAVELLGITAPAEDLLAHSVAEGREALERLLGYQWDDKLLDTIFSEFCVGK
ncbi:MAG: tRNA uridine-5-carboxymethylaminomethyl(34) synthesis GTPase MnmE [Synergistales bacterium]|nr:tRNA uridine-5-carboxymethylaminomethyl(34) synthesis GTPase MnmE [Synergistales bacterium]